MSENGAPLASGRAAHADEGMQGFGMNRCALMYWVDPEPFGT